MLAENPDDVMAGADNLRHHIGILRGFGVSPVVAINAFPGDFPSEHEAIRQIGEWFSGERRSFELPIDLRVSEWDRRVLTGATRLQYGETASYGELARHVGKPGAARAVGGAMGRNPVPILIPCHRVIAGDGTLGGYGGSNYADRRASLAIKRRLLTIEGTTVRE